MIVIYIVLCMRVYAMICIRPYTCLRNVPLLRQNELFRLFDSSFLEAVPSTLLPYTATMVWTLMMPHFSFLDQSYWFAPSSKLQSAGEDREMDE